MFEIHQKLSQFNQNYSQPHTASEAVEASLCFFWMKIQM